jgi:DNA-directed RNA polymerase beta subunit
MKSESFDKEMNYRYGKHLNTVYMTCAQDLEDGILLMNGAEGMMNAFRSTHHLINLGDNEVLLNLYGDDDHYQGLPLVGEKVKHQILAAVRRVDNAKAPYSLKKKRLRTVERGDERHFAEGRVIDITILYNKDRDKIPGGGANKLLLDLFDEQQAYYKKVYKYMIDIADRAPFEDYTYSDEFSMICEEAHDFVDSTAFFADGSESIYGNMQIIVQLMDEEKLKVGSKLVGRSANKGVVSRILKPEESWRMEDGTLIHAVVAALGIVGRLNPSQLNEHSINELSHTAIEMMKMTDDLDEKAKIVCRLMKYLNSAEADSWKEYFKYCDEKKKAKVIRQIEREGIYIVQDPVDNADMFQIMKAYESFPANYQRIVFPDGSKSMHKVLCAKMFYMRLKQDPVEKYSARSRGPVNPLTTLPAKSNLKKKGLEPYSDVAVRVGEYEIEVLLAMCNHPKAIANFMTENSTSWKAKMTMAEQIYLGEVEDDLDISEIECDGKKNVEAIDAYNNVLGSKIVMEVETAEDGEYFTDND